MDNEQTNALLNNNNFKPLEYADKSWIEIKDNNYSNYDNSEIVYNTRSVMNQKILLNESYILVTGYIKSTTNLAIGAVNKVCIKNPYEIFSRSTCTIKNIKVDELNDLKYPITLSNLLELSKDYVDSLSELEGYVKDLSNNEEDNLGHTKRISMHKGSQEAGKIHFVNVPISLKNINNFFRAIDFPIQFCDMDLRLSVNNLNCILRENDAPASRFHITNTVLKICTVKLPPEAEKNYVMKLSKGFTNTVTMKRQNILKPTETFNGHFDLLVTPSVNGPTDIYVMAVPVADSQRSLGLPTTTIDNFNVEIDGRNFLPTDISTDADAYKLLTQHMNFGGLNYNTGSLISYVEFKTLYRIYSAKLSRSESLAINPKESQQIRIRGSTSAASKLVIIYEQYQDVSFDFKQSGLDVSVRY